MTYGESKIRIRQKQCIVTPGDLSVANNITEIPEQKKTASLTLNDQETDKIKSSPNQLKELALCWLHHWSDARPTGA